MFAKIQHPWVVLVKLGPARERPERDLLLDVDHEGRVAPLLGFDAAPDGRGDDLARLGGQVIEAEALTLTAQAQVLQRQAGAFFHPDPGFDRRLAIGLRRQHQDGFGHLFGGLHHRLSLADARFGDRAQ